MRTVTKGLVFRSPARAPVILFILLQLDSDGFSVRNGWFAHFSTLVFLDQLRVGNDFNQGRALIGNGFLNGLI